MSAVSVKNQANGTPKSVKKIERSPIGRSIAKYIKGVSNIVKGFVLGSRKKAMITHIREAETARVKLTSNVEPH